MNTLRHGLVVALFFLAAQPAFAAPGPVTRLVAPAGEVAMGVPITFSWQAVPESTWYLLWLGKGTPTAFIMEQWYSADQAGCATGGGTCSITLTAPVNAGGHTWFVQTWAAGVAGPWSQGLQFVVTAPHWGNKLPDSRRFTLVLDDEGVLDNETGLVWQRTPTAGAYYTWSGAISFCFLTSSGSRRGWRAPTATELLSLLDVTRSNPSLPAGHPFNGIEDQYWTQTPSETGSAHYAVSMASGNISTTDSTKGRWCVRGGIAGVY